MRSSTRCPLQAVMGEVLDATGWREVLDEAAAAGLMRKLGSTEVYELDPTLPLFLRMRLVARVGEDGLHRLDEHYVTIYAVMAQQVLAGVPIPDLQEHAGVHNAYPQVLDMLRLEEANLLRAVQLAEQAGDWAQVKVIVQLLDAHYEANHRLSEPVAFRERLLRRMGRELRVDTDQARAHLLMYLLGTEATDALRRSQLRQAETVYQTIRSYLESLHDPSEDRELACAYQCLGRVA